MTAISAPVRTDALLSVQALDVYRGQIQVLRGVSLTIGPEPVAVVGRNGMGKSTLCEALMGLLPVRRGTIRFAGREIAGWRPFRIGRAGIGYVPQGRRVFASLTVDEHFRLAAPGPDARWSLERVYRSFPRLAGRRSQRAATLSGGEQQMLAIARALLLNPRLLIMDEPTEGLSPTIVDDLTRILDQFCGEGGRLLLVEQNLAFAARVAPTALVMVNGQIALETASAQLTTSKALQHTYLGFGDVADVLKRSVHRSTDLSSEIRG